ncbi:M28 family peptidase [Acidobacteriota bacterium]
MKVAELLAGWARKFDFENVRIEKQKYNRSNWDALSGELWVIEPREIKLGSYEEIAVSIPDNCPSAHETVELVDIGSGISDEDFEAKDVAGKAVFTSSSPSVVMQTAVWQRGATGIISCNNSRPDGIHDFADQVAYRRVPVKSPEGKPAKWAFMISPRKGTMLKNLLRKAKIDDKPVKIKVDIETEFYEPQQQSYVWAEIQGSEIHNQDIVLTSHIQEEKPSANDNASGCASMVEIGRTINRLVKEGRIPRPKRDIVFWWANEISSEYQYFRDNPDERKNMLVNINQDLVAAKQSMGSRVQHIIRTPWSIPSYLNDVIESITEYVILTNTSFMAAAQAGCPQPFSKPLLSHLGTRERYNAMVVPYFNGSDHMVFCERIIGIPGVALGNYPDFYIHSNADDLDNIDQTQLKRNAFLVAAATLFIANAGDEDVPLIASEVYSRALRRIGKDLGTALHHIRSENKGDFKHSYKEGKNLVNQAITRELRAVESILVFAKPGGRNEAYVKKQMQKIINLKPKLHKDLNELYSHVSRDKNIPPLNLSAVEKEMASKVPVYVDSVDEYFEKRGWVQGTRGLHALMAWECYNFVDGKNSYLDIYNAVHAEAMAVGSFYYGTVSLNAVKELLDNAVKAGSLRLK